MWNSIAIGMAPNILGARRPERLLRLVKRRDPESATARLREGRVKEDPASMAVENSWADFMDLKNCIQGGTAVAEPHGRCQGEAEPGVVSGIADQENRMPAQLATTLEAGPDERAADSKALMGWIYCDGCEPRETGRLSGRLDRHGREENVTENPAVLLCDE